MASSRKLSAVVGCPTCEPSAYTRNHFFTGKLLVERDFTDEQQYFMEKIRLHHQRLHGTGVVCGLQIVEHENPACRDRYVILQPGSAVDCCGKDILVVESEILDLQSFPAVRKLIDDPDDQDHTLQFCIKYAECPTEDIPVLYDECGCDDTQCAANRILERYALDAIVDPEISGKKFHQPLLEWHSTISTAHAAAVALHEATNRIYVMTAGDSGMLYQVSTRNLVIEASYPLDRRGLAMAVSPGGDQLYVAVAAPGGPASGPAELWVFEVHAKFAFGSVRDIKIEGSEGSDIIFLAAAPDDRLAALIAKGGKVRVWDAGVPPPATVEEEEEDQADIGADLRDLVFGSDGATAYLAQPGSETLHSIDLNATGLEPQTVELPGIDVHGLALVASTGPDLLAVTDKANGKLHIAEPAGTVRASIALDHPPIETVVSKGGHWAYVVERDGLETYVQTVNLQRALQGEAVAAGTPMKLPDRGLQAALTASGDRLFVAYAGDLDVEDSGGVAVIDITEQDCKGLLWNLGDCPDCETPDCLVLATVTGYRPGRALHDLTDPPSDPADDAAAGIARIDNMLGRVLLPSTQDIARALACVIETCCDGGGVGLQGPRGPQGLQGERGEQGPKGDPGVGIDRNFGHICGINWVHGSREMKRGLLEAGLRVAFDRPVRNGDLNRFTVRLLTKIFGEPSGTACWCEVEPTNMTGLNFHADCDINSNFDDATDPEAEVNGMMIQAGNLPFSILTNLSDEAREQQNTILIEDVRGIEEGMRLIIEPRTQNQEFAIVASDPRDDRTVELQTDLEKTHDKGSPVVSEAHQFKVEIHGDLIRARHKNEEWRGLDADHLPPWRPTKETPTGDGIEGGTFVSWFKLSDESSRRSINTATAEDLVTIGIPESITERIVAARSRAPFTRWENVRAVNGVGAERLALLRSRFTLP